MVASCALSASSVRIPYARHRAFELNGERRIYFMATPPDRDSMLIWRKSRASGADSGCVEVATKTSSVLVRDSRDRFGTRLAFSPPQWQLFVRLIKDGRIAPS